MAKRKLRAIRGTGKVLARLEPADVGRLRVRHDVMEHQQLLLGMTQESYGLMVRTIREKYDLPPTFHVDFDTGEVTPDPDAEEAADG